MEQSFNSKNDSAHESSLLGSLSHVVRQAGWAIVAGLVGSILLLVLFADLTEDVFSQEFTTFDNNFELWVHGFASTGLDVFFNIFTTIGSVAGISILTALTFGFLWWKGHPHMAWLIAFASGGGMLINQILKLIFRRPRPELWALTGHAPTTFSFPSGHATASFCYFGALAWLGFRFLRQPLQRWGLAVLMVVMISLVGLSRIYFGVHYPTDVIGGYLSGAVWLVLLFDGAYITRRLRQKVADVQTNQILSKK